MALEKSLPAAFQLFRLKEEIAVSFQLIPSLFIHLISEPTNRHYSVSWCWHTWDHRCGLGTHTLALHQGRFLVGHFVPTQSPPDPSIALPLASGYLIFLFPPFLSFFFPKTSASFCCLGLSLHLLTVTYSFDHDLLIKAPITKK